jgi:hypothetical protein
LETTWQVDLRRLTEFPEIGWQQIAAVVIIGFLILLVQDNVIPVMQPASNSFNMTWLDESKGIAVTIYVTVSAAQDFTATLPVSVGAYGSISNQSLQWEPIWGICACFSDAYATYQGEIIPNPNAQPFAGVYLNTTNIKPGGYSAGEDFAGEYLVGSPQTIEWQSPTQTVPYIIITYRNTTTVNGIGENVQASKGFPDKGFPIEPFSTFESNNAQLKLNATELLVFTGTVVEAMLIFVGKRKSKDKHRPVSQSPSKDKTEEKKTTGHQVSEHQQPKRARQRRQRTKAK